MKYRKKPIVIEAFQFKGGDKTHVFPSWIIDAIRRGAIFSHEPNPNMWAIKTLEGIMVAEPGDWIIQGVKGELYPCKPDIFEMTYEEVNGN